LPRFWLLKTEPSKYSFTHLQKDGSTFWEGVRNFQARNNLKAMKKGDKAFIYHTEEVREAAGIAEVSREAYADPTAPAGEDWVVVELKPQRAFRKPVSLAEIKKDPLLRKTALVTQPRLSVVPLTADEAGRLRDLGL